MRTILTSAVVAIIASVATHKGPALYDQLRTAISPPEKVAKATQGKDFWQTPAIEGFGKIHYAEQMQYRPDPAQTYKVVFQIQNSKEAKSDVNKELDKVARTVNLYAASGVPLEQLQFVVAISASATPVVLNNTHYRRNFGVDNPNLALIDKLREAGVVVTVCDQAVAGHQYAFDWVDKRVVHALSSLTTITTLEHQGYVIMPNL
ncbi:sulfur reduction protein DsrE [Enterobacterales bacterium CwR94]|nr:sulfur reduction protein DsrE [Enterobacterales bacterium CwR94]